MNRKIFLVQGNFHSAEEERADNYFIDRYFSFFTSNVGGAYDADEIEVLKRPSQQELEGKINCTTCDYSIILFLGHGATNESHHMFELNDSELILPGCENSKLNTKV